MPKEQERLGLSPPPPDWDNWKGGPTVTLREALLVVAISIWAGLIAGLAIHASNVERRLDVICADRVDKCDFP